MPIKADEWILLAAYCNSRDYGLFNTKRKDITLIVIVEGLCIKRPSKFLFWICLDLEVDIFKNISNYFVVQGDQVQTRTRWKVKSLQTLKRLILLPKATFQRIHFTTELYSGWSARLCRTRLCFTGPTLTIPYGTCHHEMYQSVSHLKIFTVTSVKKYY